MIPVLQFLSEQMDLFPSEGKDPRSEFKVLPYYAFEQGNNVHRLRDNRPGVIKRVYGHLEPKVIKAWIESCPHDISMQVIATIEDGKIVCHDLCGVYKPNLIGVSGTSIFSAFLGSGRSTEKEFQEKNDADIKKITLFMNKAIDHLPEGTSVVDVDDEMLCDIMAKVFESERLKIDQDLPLYRSIVTTLPKKEPNGYKYQDVSTVILTSSDPEFPINEKMIQFIEKGRLVYLIKASQKKYSLCAMLCLRKMDFDPLMRIMRENGMRVCKESLIGSNFEERSWPLNVDYSEVTDIRDRFINMTPEKISETLSVGASS